jgi:hypothetical protein
MKTTVEFVILGVLTGIGAVRLYEMISKRINSLL